MFHCFGCGAGGDAFAFLMKHEGMGFMEAVRDLAQQVGVPISEEKRNYAGSDAASDRERFEHIHALAASWFRNNLRKSLKEKRHVNTWKVGESCGAPLKNSTLVIPHLGGAGLPPILKNRELLFRNYFNRAW